ncbi:hypothetical protein [Streptomyces sp. NPDC002133]|uniref:hypothetical protein n=1 Tax=Streptomyces sp. NPDC002133 TaxID=3154409 RepID=UPI0033239669
MGGRPRRGRGQQPRCTCCAGATARLGSAWQSLRLADRATRDVSPAELRRAAEAELVAPGEWAPVHEEQRRHLETAWLTARLGSVPRYYLHPLDGTDPSAESQGLSAALEAALRLEHPHILDRITDIGDRWAPADADDAATDAERWTTAAARALDLADNPHTVPEASDEDLAASWKLLHAVSLHTADRPGLDEQAAPLLAELAARSVEAQRLRAVLEPPQAEALLAAETVGPFDGPTGLDPVRAEQTESARAAAEAYTRARLLQGTGLAPHPAQVRERALREAQVSTFTDVATTGTPGAPSRDGGRDGFADAWMVGHPTTRAALSRERQLAEQAAERATGPTPPPRAAAEAVYWQLRADRTAATHSVLSHLTTVPPGDSNPYSAMVRGINANAVTTMLPTVFGSEQRAMQVLAATAAYLDNLHTQTRALLLTFQTEGPYSDFPDPSAAAAADVQAWEATTAMRARRQLALAMHEATAALARLFPHLPPPGADGIDPARIRQAAADLTAGAATRREQTPPAARPPTAHDPTQQAAHTASRQAQVGGPTPA